MFEVEYRIKILRRAQGINTRCLIYFLIFRVGQYDFFPPKLHSGPFPKKQKRVSHLIPNSIVFPRTTWTGLCGNIWFAILFLYPVKVLRTRLSGWDDLTFKRHWIDHVLPPRAPTALLIGVTCSSQPRLSEHAWVHQTNSRQNPDVTGMELKHGDLTFKLE